MVWGRRFRRTEVQWCHFYINPCITVIITMYNKWLAESLLPTPFPVLFLFCFWLQVAIGRFCVPDARIFHTRGTLSPPAFKLYL